MAPIRDLFRVVPPQEPPCVNWLLILTMSALACMMLVALLYCVFQMCRRRSPKVILERSDSDNGTEEHQHPSSRSVVQRLVALLEQDDSPDLKQQRQRHPLPIPKGNTAAVSKLLLEKAKDAQQDNGADQLLRLEGMDSALNKSRQDSTQSRVQTLRALYEQAGSPVLKQQTSLHKVPVAGGNTAAILKLLLEKAKDSPQDSRVGQLLRLEGMDSALNMNRQDRQDSTQLRVQTLRALYEQAGSPVQKQQQAGSPAQKQSVSPKKPTDYVPRPVSIEQKDPERSEEHSEHLSLQQARAQPVVMAKADPDVDKSKAKDAGISHDSQTPGGNASVSGLAPPLAASTLPPTRLTMDDFVLHKVLGSGFFGKVLLAELKGHGEYFAVKAVNKVKVVERGAVKHAMVEKKVLTLAEGNPFLAHLYCSFQTKEHLFFVMEYVSGGDLDFFIENRGCLDLESATFYAAEIVVGLQFLHSKGIIHRDVKPGNMMLDRDGHIKIVDFGMCSMGKRMASTVLGTPPFIAPEILKRRRRYSFSVDWWSFGVLVCRMLTGHYPSHGKDVEKRYPYYKEDVEESFLTYFPRYPFQITMTSKDLLMKLLRRDPYRRLGVMGNIRVHPFFRQIEWDALEKREVTPPFKPTVKAPNDCRHFHPRYLREKPCLSHGDKHKLKDLEQVAFAGFSFITSKMKVMLDKGECLGHHGPTAVTSPTTPPLPTPWFLTRIVNRLLKRQRTEAAAPASGC